MLRRSAPWLWLAGVACLVAPTSAHADPTQPGELVNELLTPMACEFCHVFPNPDNQALDPPYAPFRTWQGSLMANAARDPVFWAGVAVADQDEPGETELCIRCHSPRAFLNGNGDATTIDELTVAEQEGVECMVCHRMTDDPAVLEPGNANYTIDDVLVGENVPRRGPWDFSDGVPEPPHSYINDPYTGSSELCGTCHDVTTERERVDDDGVGLGVPFNEQRTYREWLNSDFAEPGPSEASCQDCHMPEVEDMSGCVQHVNQFSHAEGGRKHDLVGANRFMVELIKSEYGLAGSNQINDLYYDTTLDSMDAFLPTAATVEIEGPSEVDLTDGVEGLQVTVTNNTGHKLPTGYSEGRVMWIEVLAEYDDQVIASSGRWNQAAGIQRDPQLHTYEAIGEDYADGTTFHLLRNNHWVLDTRIPPMGLEPDLETDPVGDRYTLLGNGTWPNFDVQTYAFDNTADVFDVTPGDLEDNFLVVRVRLRYVINTADYIDFLGEEGSEAGVEVAALFEAAGGAPALTVTEQVLVIPISGFGAEGGSSSGSSADTASSGPGDGASTTSSATGSADTTGTAPTATDGALTGADTTGGTRGTGGDDGSDDDSGGCDCRTPGSPAAPALLLVPLLFRRRRREA